MAWQKLLKRDPCCYCGETESPSRTIDHIIPKSAGGRLWDWQNLTAACSKCNTKKGSKPLIFFLLELNGGKVDWRSYWADKLGKPYEPPSSPSTHVVDSPEPVYDAVCSGDPPEGGQT